MTKNPESFEKICSLRFEILRILYVTRMPALTTAFILWTGLQNKIKYVIFGKTWIRVYFLFPFLMPTPSARNVRSLQNVAVATINILAVHGVSFLKLMTERDYELRVGPTDKCRWQIVLYRLSYVTACSERHNDSVLFCSTRFAIHLL